MAPVFSASPLPPFQTAIKQAGWGVLVVREDAPIPVLEPDMVLVKTVAVALNPCDHKMPARFPSPGATAGADFAGFVVALGSAILKDVRVGDRVFGVVHAANPISHESGTFAQYVAAYSDLLVKIPDGMPWEDAASIGGAVIGTLGIALFMALGIPAHPENPTEKPFHVLVYGGSTSTGTMAIQLLTLSGVKCITTCSPKNFDLVKSYGAEKVFDYHLSTCAEDIRAYTRNTLKYVLDVIAEAKTMRLCYAAIGRVGGKYIALELIPEELTLGTRKTVKAQFVNGITMTGKKIALAEGYESEANPDLRKYSRLWFATVQQLVDNRRLRSHPPKVNRGGEAGFQGILQGIEIMRRREVSGEKLIYFIPSS